MYTAAVLTDISADLLRWIMKGTLDLEQRGFVTKNGNQKLPHHMTICLGGIENSPHQVTLLGAEATLRVSHMFYHEDLGVCAVPVVKATVSWTTGDGEFEPLPLQSTNNVPHITVCLKPYAKPRTSNEMLERTDDPQVIRVNFDQAYDLKAVVREIG
jgi:hypothetical protein